MTDIVYNEDGVKFDEKFVSWDELENARDQFKFANSVLVKLSFRYGRVTEIEDQGIYDRDEWAKIKTALSGRTAWYSDFAGKHSETTVDFFDPSSVTLEEITDLKTIIDFNQRHGMSNNDLDMISTAICQAQENGELDDDLNPITEDN